MRYVFATGALALLLCGATVGASAKETVPTNPHATVAGASAALSPDVAEWTATLVKERQTEKPAAKHGIKRFASRVLARTTTIAANLTRSALKFLGVPYVFGGTEAAGFDCSGYVQHVFAMMGISIPRTADAQYYAEPKATGGLRPGDLVFFQTYEPGPSHVGIYIGAGKFVDASSSRGVTISSLSNSYWAPRYIGARRVLASL